MLVMRECGAPAAGGCALCGRQLCVAHAVMGQSGPACPQCASHTAGYDVTEDIEISEARDEYYSQYGGASSFGHRGFFSGHDSAAMAQRGIPQKPAQQRRYDAKET
jgi:hypothetical protein